MYKVTADLVSKDEHSKQRLTFDIIGLSFWEMAEIINSLIARRVDQPASRRCIDPILLLLIKLTRDTVPKYKRNIERNPYAHSPLADARMVVWIEEFLQAVERVEARLMKDA